MTPARRAELVLCAAMALAGGLLYGRFFAGTAFLAPVCAAAVLGTVVAVPAGTRCWGPYRTALAAVGGAVLLVCYGVLSGTLEHGLPGRQTVVELADGAFGGWTRMLAVAPPADPRPALLITPVLLTWAAAFAATTLVLRTRIVFAPVAPPLVAFAAALLFVGRRPGIQVAATAVFLVAALALVLVRANADTGTGRVATGRLVFGAPVVVVVALLGVSGALVLPLADDDERFEPRAVLPPPVRVADALTPLAGLKAQLRAAPPRRLFTVRVTGGAPVDRIRVAALDRFDGASWTSADRFLVAGTQLPADPAMTRSRPVFARVEVEGLTGPFLPAVGWPVRLDRTGGVGFGTTSGVLVSTRSVPRGTTYTVVGAVAERDSGLARAVPSTIPGHRGLDGLPLVLRAVARELTATERTPYRKLAAIEEHLRGLPYRLDTPPGHSYAALVRMLTGSGEGYAEQRASAFAVLARAAGFPARVAVGYRLDDRRTGVHVVTTRDAHAWAEVHFDGYGWVVFEPTGTTAGASARSDDADAVPPPPPPDTRRPPRADPPEARDQPRDHRPGVPGAAIAAGLVLAVSVTSVLSAKAWRRRRRRNAPGAAARVVGAWREVTDRLVERGVAVPASLTAHEVAERATRAMGAVAEPVMRLAPLVTAAVYARDDPDEDVVAEAWSLEQRLRGLLYPRRRLPLRLVAALDPRPLLTSLRATGESR
jgi:transglutaminase-like putative cysteine protease